MDGITVKVLSVTDIMKEDGARIRFLLGQLSKDPAKPSDSEVLQVIIENTVFVARDVKDQIVGMATLVTYNKLNGHVGVVEDVVVDEDQRGRKIGRALMVRLIETARSIGLDSLELTSNPTRTEARALYQSLGFVGGRTTHFELEL